MTLSRSHLALPFAASLCTLALAGPADAQLQHVGGGRTDLRPSAAAVPPTLGEFTDVTTESGLVASYGSLTHSFVAGGAVGDFDRDGWQDVFYPAGGNGPDKLFINDRDGTFTDRAASWGVALTHRSTAAAVGDYDGDGWLDLYVTSLGPTSGAQAGQHKLYRNTGNGSFVNVAPLAGVSSSSSVTPDGWGAAWGDYDLDGDLDLAVAGWLSSDGNRVFRNNGSGTFTDITTSSAFTTLASVPGFAPRFVDMNDDFAPEVIWIGDFGTSRYYVNDGNGSFTDFTGPSGTAHDGTEMGMTVADFDLDGDFDFYVTTIATNNLYLNQGGNTFFNGAAAAGVVNTGWGWGTVAIDFNHDTLVDLVATTQSGRQYAFRNTTTNQGQPTFVEVANSIGLVSNADGRGLANLDYDNDGDQDVIIFPRGSVRLFRSEAVGHPRAAWLRVLLDRGTATDVAPDGIGSVVELTIDGRKLVGRMDGGSNYMSQSELSVHFGLGDHSTVDVLRVRWPNGTVSELLDVAANRTITIVHP